MHNKPQATTLETWNQLKQFTQHIPRASARLQLKTRDELAIAHKPWKELVYTLDANLTANLDKTVKEVNGLVVSYFGLKQHQNGFLIKIEPLITAIVKAHLHQMHVRDVRQKVVPKLGKSELHLPEDSRLKIKISMDGRALGGMSAVVITLQVLNLQTFATQDPCAVFPIGMYVGDEEEISAYFNELPADMKTIITNGLTIEEDEKQGTLGIALATGSFIKKLAVDFYWVSDLKSLACVTKLREENMFCFKCLCKRTEALVKLNILDATQRDLEHLLPIPDGNVFICIIHLDERVTEYLLKMTLKSSKKEADILKSLRTIGMFDDFSFSTSTVAPKDVNEELMALLIKEYKFMLTGPHCGRLMGNLSTVLGFLEEEDPNMWKIWKSWRVIRRWIYLTNEDLAKKTVEEVNELQKQLREWGADLKRAKCDGDHIGDYIHILVNHYYYIMTTIGSLAPLSGEAVEHSHKWDRFLMDRSTSRGKKALGGEHITNTDTRVPESTKNNNGFEVLVGEKEFNYQSIVDVKLATKASWNDLYQICQILMKKLRIIYLSFSEEDVTFHRMELRTGKRKEEFWTRDVSSILQPPKFITTLSNSQPNQSQNIQPVQFQAIAAPENGERARNELLDSPGQVSEEEVAELTARVVREEVRDSTYKASYCPQDDCLSKAVDSDSDCGSDMTDE